MTSMSTARVMHTLVALVLVVAAVWVIAYLVRRWLTTDNVRPAGHRSIGGTLVAVGIVCALGAVYLASLACPFPSIGPILLLTILIATSLVAILTANTWWGAIDGQSRARWHVLRKMPWLMPLFVGVTAAGVIAIGFVSITCNKDCHAIVVFGGGVLIAGAALLVGAVLGLLFGIPLTSEKKSTASKQLEAAASDKATPATAAKAVSEVPTAMRVDPVSVVAQYKANTNLEEISSWLTKILLGAGLTQMGALGHKLDSIAAVSATVFGFRSADPGMAHAIAAALIIYFLAAGLLFGYLFTRIVMPEAFLAADTGFDPSSLESKMDHMKGELTQELRASSEDSKKTSRVMSWLQEASRIVDEADRSEGQDKIDKLKGALVLTNKALYYDPDYSGVYVQKARVLRRLVDVRRALAVVNVGLSKNPKEPFLLYNRACYACVLGQPTDGIIADLKQAFKGMPELREDALFDPDFSRIKNEPAFVELLPSPEHPDDAAGQG